MPALPKEVRNITIFGSWLSGDFQKQTLPTFRDFNASAQKEVSILLMSGNRFRNCPSWLPQCDHLLLVSSPFEVIALACAGPVFAFVLLLCALRCSRHPFHSVVEALQSSSHSFTEQVHLSSLSFLLRGMLVAGSALAIYALAPRIYAEGDYLAPYSFAYFATSTLMDQIVLCAWCAFQVGSCAALWKAPTRRSRENGTDLRATSVCRQCVFAFAWIVFSICASAPAAVYAYVKSVSLGVDFPHANQYVLAMTAALMVLVSSILLPHAANFFSSASSVRSEKYLMFSAALVNWIIPAICIAVLDPHCGGLWIRFTLTDCVSPSQAATFFRGGDNDCSEQGREGGHCTLSTADLCLNDNTDIQHVGFCAQTVIEFLTPLLLTKLLITAFVMPVVSITLLALSKSDSADATIFFLPGCCSLHKLVGCFVFQRDLLKFDLSNAVRLPLSLIYAVIYMAPGH